jgi:hypothetical protein
MTVSNGNITRMWIAILIAGMGASSTITYTVAKSQLDNSAARLEKLEITTQRIESKLDEKFLEIIKEKSKDHAKYEERLTRLETKIDKL